MDIEQNKRSMRRVFEEGFNTGNLAVVDECLAPDAVDWHGLTAETTDFRAHLKFIIGMLRDALPDLNMRVEDLVAEGDRVAARVRLTGTHTGAPIEGIAARGARVDIEQFHFIRCDEEGRGVTHRAAAGVDDLLRQIQAASPQPVR